MLSPSSRSTMPPVEAFLFDLPEDAPPVECPTDCPMEYVRESWRLITRFLEVGVDVVAGGSIRRASLRFRLYVATPVGELVHSSVVVGGRREASKARRARSSLGFVSLSPVVAG